MADITGPIIVWINHGYEGWSPTSYPTLKDALIGERYGSEFVVTSLIHFDVIEVVPPADSGGAA